MVVNGILLLPFRISENDFGIISFSLKVLNCSAFYIFRMLLLTLCLGISYGYVSVSWLDLNVSRFTVFQWISRFCNGYTTFCGRKAIFAAVLPLAWRVCTV